MPYDYRILCYVILISTAVILGIFSVPPLTSGGTRTKNGVSQATFDATVSQELAYCQTQPEDINCRCFANISVAILTHNEPRVLGATYADKQELARGQAGHTC